MKGMILIKYLKILGKYKSENNFIGYQDNYVGNSSITLQKFFTLPISLSILQNYFLVE